MKQGEIKDRNDKDLRARLSELRERQRVLKFDLASGKVKNVREIRSVRKDVARILTELRVRTK